MSTSILHRDAARARKAAAITAYLTDKCADHDPDLIAEILPGMGQGWWDQAAAECGQRSPSPFTIDMVCGVFAERAERASLPDTNPFEGLSR